MSKKISVIIPCYNQSKFLGETLQSVLNQSYSNWECIIINDGSTDETERIANKFINCDSRFKYFFKENGGLSSARNFGLRLAMGEYIQFLDADDLLVSNKFELQLQDLIENDISISNYISFIDGTTEKAPNRYLSPFLPGKFAHCIKTNKPILLLGPYYSEAKRLLGEDYPYWSPINEVDQIKEIIEKMYILWKKNQTKYLLNRDDLKDYLSHRYLKFIFDNKFNE